MFSIATRLTQDWMVGGTGIEPVAPAVWSVPELSQRSNDRTNAGRRSADSRRAFGTWWPPGLTRSATRLRRAGRNAAEDERSRFGRYCASRPGDGVVGSDGAQ